MVGAAGRVPEFADLLTARERQLPPTDGAGNGLSAARHGELLREAASGRPDRCGSTAPAPSSSPCADPGPESDPERPVRETIRSADFRTGTVFASA